MVKITCKDGDGATITCPNGDVLYIRYLRKNGVFGLAVAAPPQYKVDRKMGREKTA